MGMNLIQTGRFNRLFQKLFSIKGGANVTEVGAEILPVIPIRIGVEVRYLEQWERFASYNQAAAVAAQFGALRLRNPAGSNVIAVIEKATFAIAAATLVSSNLSAQTADLGTIALGTSRLDPRGRAVGSMIVSFGTLAATPSTSIWSGQGVANTTVDEILTEGQEIPLLPGDAFTMFDFTANEIGRFSFTWRERAMEESELK